MVEVVIQPDLMPLRNYLARNLYDITKKVFRAPIVASMHWYRGWPGIRFGVPIPRRYLRFLPHKREPVLDFAFVWGGVHNYAAPPRACNARERFNAARGSRIWLR